MAVITTIKTNASMEEIIEAIDCYNNNVEIEDVDTYEIYMSPYDNYHLSCESANDILGSNLNYEFKKTGRLLEFKILKTELT